MKNKIGKLIIIGWLIVGVAPGIFAQTREECYQTAYIYFSQGKYEQAEEWYRKAVEIDPHFWEARYWLGKTQEQLGKIKEALEEWTMILMVQPDNRDVFQKWRYYAPSYVQLREDDIRRLKSIFLEDGNPSFSEEEAWRELMPQAFLLLERKDFISPYLGARIMRWGGRNLSSLFYSYERRGYERALDNLILNLEGEDPELVYQFIKECESRFGEDENFQEKLSTLYEKIFAQQIGESPEKTGGVSTVELQVEGREVKVSATRGEEDALLHPDTGFYLGE
ncbi:MAG TPA: tetratricopeptide repeat protein [Candidatus Atribacteria bacterium]|nr:tetratricopeptide repeat protein [Candidatus Atribacteria bacterium]HPZ81340.1 tetratricopeptide repeat protein [Candidatus Atribacteria bacterium]